MRWTCFEKRNFMGIELDVLVGHPEHDLLFVATQVARAAGLKQPANSASAYRRVNKAGMALMTLIQDGCIRLEDIPADERDQRLRTTTVIFTESESYQMLLRGHAPQPPSHSASGSLRKSSRPSERPVLTKLRIPPTQSLWVSWMNSRRFEGKLLEHLQDVPSDSAYESEASERPKSLHESATCSVYRRSHARGNC